MLRGITVIILVENNKIKCQIKSQGNVQHLCLMIRLFLHCILSRLVLKSNHRAFEALTHFESFNSRTFVPFFTLKLKL
jgi:hypothetical protein